MISLPKSRLDSGVSASRISCSNRKSLLNKFTKQGDVNITLGKYDAVINEYLPIVNELDKRGVQQLIFALEGMDRSEEALDILKTNPLLLEDAQTHGLLGGRFKRKYLLSSVKKFGEESIKYYKMAYEHSIEIKNKKEIYFNAINLAFLSLMVHGSDEEMTKYATVAIENAKKDAFDNLWKLATLGEANLYLGNLKKSKKFYAKASKMAGIREKLSIHSNASLAYLEMSRTENPEDDYVVFLKDHFLL